VYSLGMERSRVSSAALTSADPRERHFAWLRRISEIRGRSISDLDIALLIILLLGSCGISMAVLVGAGVAITQQIERLQ
jgi:hypothetical protein